MNSKTIKVGDVVQSERLGACRVVRVRPFGTIDVECLANGQCYRISGLVCGQP